LDRVTIPPELIARVRSEFALSWDGIHGVAHWERVCDNGLQLAKLTGANPQVVALFAFLHDAKRVNNGRDPGHGKRAAEFTRSLCGSLIALPDEDLELLAFACEYHTAGLTEAHVTVQTCWDADRLDLGRIGIRPDPRHLCTPAAKEPAMIEWALNRSRGEVHTE
jgi:uncharacterized protein